MTHAAVFTGSGHHCSRCGVAWDQDEPEPETCAVADPTTYQIAGKHYSGLSIQPVTYAMRNDLDFCAGSILKYLSRHRQKNGVEDLRKARHFVELREASGRGRTPKQNISMGEYVIANRITGDDSRALLALDFYLRGGVDEGGVHLMMLIDKLIAGYDSPLTHP